MQRQLCGVIDQHVVAVRDLFSNIVRNALFGYPAFETRPQWLDTP
jgi:hypothetical protein